MFASARMRSPLLAFVDVLVMKLLGESKDTGCGAGQVASIGECLGGGSGSGGLLRCGASASLELSDARFGLCQLVAELVALLDQVLDVSATSSRKSSTSSWL